MVIVHRFIRAKALKPPWPLQAYTRAIWTSWATTFLTGNTSICGILQTRITSPKSAGIWFPGEYAGPTAGSSSSPSYNGFGTGVGYARIPKRGTLTNFKLTQASPSGSTVTNLQVYIAPVGIPSLFAFSGLSLGVVAGDYISTDNVSQLSVFEDDIIAIYNAEFFGWTPDAMTITADLLLN